MKKMMLFFILVSFAFCYEPVKSNDNRALGLKLFKAKGCVMCHKKSKLSIGPSIEQIAMGYSGKEMELIYYLQGKREAIISPSKAHIMQAQFLKLNSINEKKIRAIARFIVTIKDREF
jgi:cytochrome c551/c552